MLQFAEEYILSMFSVLSKFPFVGIHPFVDIYAIFRFYPTHHLPLGVGKVPKECIVLMYGDDGRLSSAGLTENGIFQVYLANCSFNS